MNRVLFGASGVNRLTSPVRHLLHVHPARTHREDSEPDWDEIHDANPSSIVDGAHQGDMTIP
jgi:hypothetical protein